jgi:hypothetical protein
LSLFDRSLELISQSFSSVFLSQQISISISSGRRNDQPNKAIIGTQEANKSS